jgi:hypothetical protein
MLETLLVSDKKISLKLFELSGIKKNNTTKIQK